MKRSQSKSNTGKRSEKSIQRGILAWLKRQGYLHWRQNAGRLPGNRFSMGPNGVPDIIVVIPPNGRFLGLEVKSATGRLRPSQREFGQWLLDCGAGYYVVRTLKDAKKAVDEFTAENNSRSRNMGDTSHSARGGENLGPLFKERPRLRALQEYTQDS